MRNFGFPQKPTRERFRRLELDWVFSNEPKNAGIFVINKRAWDWKYSWQSLGACLVFFLRFFALQPHQRKCALSSASLWKLILVNWIGMWHWAEKTLKNCHQWINVTTSFFKINFVEPLIYFMAFCCSKVTEVQNSSNSFKLMFFTLMFKKRYMI